MKESVLKKTLRHYLDKDFWKDCKVPFSTQNESYILHILRKEFRNPKLDLLPLLGKIPFFKPFLSFLITSKDRQILVEKTIHLIQYLHPYKIGLKTKILGCSEIFWFKVRDREQYIYLVGEDHNWAGNSARFLKTISKDVDCPIHVLVEKSFGSYWSLRLKSDIHSNSLAFYFPPLSECTKKGSVPKDNEILDLKYRNFYKTCIEPYKGRIKLWAIDLRRTSIFHLATRVGISIVYSMDEKKFLQNIKKKTEWKRWYESSLDFQRSLFDFPLARTDMDAYNQKVLEALYHFYSSIPKDAAYPSMPKKDLEDTVSMILKSTDKSHLDLARSVLHFPTDVVAKWVKHLKDGLNTNHPVFNLFMISIHDLYCVLRIYRILRQTKNGFLFFFGGFGHSKNIASLLRDCQSPSVPVDFLFEFQCKDKEHTFQLPIPRLECAEKSERMMLYEKNKK